VKVSQQIDAKKCDDDDDDDVDNNNNNINKLM
jgi:hypothetical protein